VKGQWTDYEPVKEGLAWKIAGWEGDPGVGDPDDDDTVERKK